MGNAAVPSKMISEQPRSMKFGRDGMLGSSPAAYSASGASKSGVPHERQMQGLILTQYIVWSCCTLPASFALRPRFVNDAFFHSVYLTPGHTISNTMEKLSKFNVAHRFQKRSLLIA